ncbi:MAG TPA: hypothetical protein VND91_05725 [Candidatus Saccharimonadia bacterium]|nr:hypothetical protein [Candidatus Saccharimonadia bacterium]
MHRSVVTAGLAVALVFLPSMVGAAEPGELATARFAIEGTRLDRAEPPRAEARFELDSRLVPESPAPRTGGAFALSAKLLDATTTACVAPPDALFADGFE